MFNHIHYGYDVESRMHVGMGIGPKMDLKSSFDGPPLQPSRRLDALGEIPGFPGFFDKDAGSGPNINEPPAQLVALDDFQQSPGLDHALWTPFVVRRVLEILIEPEYVAEVGTLQELAGWTPVQGIGYAITVVRNGEVVAVYRAPDRGWAF
jgi:hypothetical protein